MLNNVDPPPQAPSAEDRCRASARAPLGKHTARHGQPAHPNTAKALREAAAKPKPEDWGKRANAWMMAAKAERPE